MLRTKCLFVVAMMSLVQFFSNSASAQTREQRLKNHVYYLASDSLHGRKAGSEDAAKVADYLIAEYSAMGLKPLFKDGWKQQFRHEESPCGYFTNIAGIIKGHDPVLKNEFIVLGAHYDHIGTKKDGTVFNGADDNASGTATLLELTRELLRDSLSFKRSIIIAAFDAEELGLYGSTALAKKMKDEGLIDKVKLMVSIDMVGWLEKGGHLTLEGTGTIKDGKKFLTDIAKGKDIDLKFKKFEGSILTATDTESFALCQTPTLAVTTGLKSPYHKPGDDAELIDYQGMDKICDYLADVTRSAAQNDSFAGSGRVASKHSNRFRPFEMGIAAGMGSSNLSFKNSGISTGKAFSYSAGITSKINFSKFFGLRVDARYEQAASLFPVEDDLYNSKGKYTQHSLCVPACMVLQIKRGVFSAFVGFGGFYRHKFDSKYSDKVVTEYPTRNNQFGTAFTFGFGLGKWTLEWSRLNNFSQFSGTGVKARMRTAEVSIVKWF